MVVSSVSYLTAVVTSSQSAAQPMTTSTSVALGSQQAIPEIKIGGSECSDAVKHIVVKKRVSVEERKRVDSILNLLVAARIKKEEAHRESESDSSSSGSDISMELDAKDEVALAETKVPHNGKEKLPVLDRGACRLGLGDIRAIVSGTNKK